MTSSTSDLLFSPWSLRTQLYSAPGSVLLKLALGEAPETIPALADVRARHAVAAERTRIRAIDRVLAHFAATVRIVRVHASAAAMPTPGLRHTGFDDLEVTLGLSRLFRIDSADAVDVDDLVDALRMVGVVEAASPHYLCALPFEHLEPKPLDELRNIDAWASSRQVHSVEALAYETGDPSVIVGVIDSGVQMQHAELRGRIRPGLDTVELHPAQLAAQLTLVGDSDRPDHDPDDVVGHGTACASIIAARGDSMPPGLGGDCRILPMRVLAGARFPGKRAVSGVGSIADIDRGLKLGIDLGARVLNLSFGTPEDELDAQDPVPHADVVRYGEARGCIMVAASGNSGGQRRYSPACLEEVIAVGAVDEENLPATFSTGGAHVDLTAPGVRVLGAGLEGYALVTGTSFAAPFVTATVALLAARAAARAFPLDRATAKRALTASAQPFPAQSNVEGLHGAGVLNAEAALRLLDAIIDAEDAPLEN